MYLDYSKLEFDANGLPETPQLVLKTLGDKMVGIIPGVVSWMMPLSLSITAVMDDGIPVNLNSRSLSLWFTILKVPPEVGT